MLRGREPSQDPSVQVEPKYRVYRDLERLFRCDGACVPNPGDGSWAVVLFEDEVPKLVRRGFMPGITNNIAEAEAMIRAMLWARELGVMAPRIQTDSKWCVDVVTKRWRVKAHPIREFMARAAILAYETRANLSWIPRESNTLADYHTYIAVNAREVGPIELVETSRPLRVAKQAAKSLKIR
jgi:ribonuclease HI